jgi:hypothetical protein
MTLTLYVTSSDFASCAFTLTWQPVGSSSQALTGKKECSLCALSMTVTFWQNHPGLRPRLLCFSSIAVRTPRSWLCTVNVSSFPRSKAALPALSACHVEQLGSCSPIKRIWTSASVPAPLMSPAANCGMFGHLATSLSSGGWCLAIWHTKTHSACRTNMQQYHHCAPVNIDTVYANLLTP